MFGLWRFFLVGTTDRWLLRVGPRRRFFDLDWHTQLTGFPASRSVECKRPGSRNRRAKKWPVCESIDCRPASRAEKLLIADFGVLYRRRRHRHHRFERVATPTLAASARFCCARDWNVNPRNATLDVLERPLREAGVIFLEDGQMVDGGAGVRFEEMTAIRAPTH